MSILQFMLRGSRAKRWRAALACLLIGVTVFAPIARAVCDLEHFAAAGGAVYTSATDASDAEASAATPGCGDQPDAMTEHRKPATPETAVTPSTPLPQFLPSASSYLSLPRTAIGPVHARHRLLPPEPAFRRVPKLLI